jgi:hypothetical protein
VPSIGGETPPPFIYVQAAVVQDWRAGCRLAKLAV